MTRIISNEMNGLRRRRGMTSAAHSSGGMLQDSDISLESKFLQRMRQESHANIIPSSTVSDVRNSLFTPEEREILRRTEQREGELDAGSLSRAPTLREALCGFYCDMMDLFGYGSNRSVASVSRHRGAHRFMDSPVQFVVMVLVACSLVAMAGTLVIWWLVPDAYMPAMIFCVSMFSWWRYWQWWKSKPKLMF